jgi:poly-gamma-glutamate synthesis protein (capsule biosynthesis protein)
MRNSIHKFLLAGLLISLLLSGCAAQSSRSDEVIINTDNFTSSSPIAPTTTPQSEPTPTNTPTTVWVNPFLPESLLSNVTLNPKWQQVGEPDGADILLTVSEESPISTWVYALAAPFPTIADDIPAASVLQLWLGQSDPEMPVQHLLLDAETAGIFEEIWGKPSKQTVEIAPSVDISTFCWQSPDTWTILPFEKLDHTWKIVAIDGQSPIRKDFDTSQYLLKAPISMITNHENIDIKQNDILSIPISNRDPEKLSTVVLTGVTALVRATAQLMELNGMTYPAQDIGPWLREADILHINNEVPFAANCPPPFPRENNLVFCSKEKYIQLLEDIGTDVVELSGDHFQDWGDEAVHFTLDLYRERGWKYYGGGENLADGQKPLLMEHNGNRFAFLGCNAKGRGYASASETQPGAVFCNFDVLTTQIEELRQQGYLPIVTFQHLEYYDYKISPHLQEDFVKVAQAGAIIVSGSQAHQPHAFEFFNDAFLHYGLGNLFFDQLKEGIPMQQAFIDRHVFYDGKHISTELLTIRFVDYARSRPMTPEERAELLQTVFSLSIWHQP